MKARSPVSADYLPRVNVPVSRSTAQIGWDLSPHFDTLRINTERGDTVLDCLDHIRSREDRTLAYRSSCLHAVCGSCAVRVNDRPLLACQTQGSRLTAEITIIKVEPLRNFQIIKDLVVDLTPLYQQIQDIMPWLAADDDRTVETDPPDGMNRTNLVDRDWSASCARPAIPNAACSILPMISTVQRRWSQLISIRSTTRTAPYPGGSNGLQVSMAFGNAFDAMHAAKLARKI